MEWSSRLSDLNKRLSDIEQQIVTASGRRNYSIRAPVSGHLTALQISEGQKLNTHSPLLAILPTETISGNIDLHNISFRYSKSESFIIQNASAEIQTEQSVAIIGSSGCGKSTLLKLMLGLLKAETGELEIDGIALEMLGNENYRQQIAAVMQDDQLLSGSIADNICFFDPDFDQKEIEASAKLAAIHKDIMSMPMAYNSLIGDMGNTLSGGQKQRLILARALYKRPTILFLDEATSHLDTGLESQVNESIKYLNMTRIIIAHRQETINSADRVLKIDKGSLVEVFN